MPVTIYRTHIQARAVVPCCFLFLSLVPAAVVAAPVLTSADARIAFVAPTSCEVMLRLAVSGATDVEHRLESLEGSRSELIEVSGGDLVGQVREIGRTRALVVRPREPSYTIHYRVDQTPGRANRCPIWLPTAPADGRSRNVHIRVVLPTGMAAAGTMPTFVWSGPEGVATLPHLPAFVIVPYAAEGEARPWDVSRVMDAAAVGTLAVASAVWLRRQKGRRA